MPFGSTRTDLEMIILSEVSQTEKDRHHGISLVYGTYDMNGPVQETGTDSQTQRRAWWLPAGEDWSGRLELAGASFYIYNG